MSFPAAAAGSKSNRNAGSKMLYYKRLYNKIQICYDGLQFSKSTFEEVCMRAAITKLNPSLGK